MWKVRRGFLAWLLFALSCLVPGWLLNDRLAAEVQLECGAPPLWHARQWRYLAPTGRECLCAALRRGPLWRSHRACQLLWAYHDPVVSRARIESIQDFGPNDNYDALAGSEVLSDWGSIGTALDGMADEDLLRLMANAPRPSQVDSLVDLLRLIRPERCERVVLTLLRSTDRPQVARAALQALYRMYSFRASPHSSSGTPPRMRPNSGSGSSRPGCRTRTRRSATSAKDSFPLRGDEVEASESVDDPAKVIRAAGVILLLRGTGAACAGLIAGTTLFLENDPLRWWMLVPLLGGVLTALLSLPVMKGSRAAFYSVLPIVLTWVTLVAQQAWQVREVPLWLLPLPALFLPDVYAVWTLWRRRGRLFVARAMVVLCVLSSLGATWWGAACLLA